MALSMITLLLWMSFIFAPIISGTSEWTIDVKRHIDVLNGSDIVIPCRFTYPSAFRSNDVKVYWKKEENKPRKGDENPCIFHHDSSQIIETYRGRTTLVGNVHDGNCSLQIKNIIHDESGLYVRVILEKPYSFYESTVSIKVNAGATRRAVTSPPAVKVTEVKIKTTPHTTSRTTIIYPTKIQLIDLTTAQTPASSLPPITFVAVPIASVFMVGIVAFIAFLIYRKFHRPQSLNRTTSEYYANFSRSSVNQTKDELSGLKSTPQEPGEKFIDDEPMYGNLQPLSHWSDTPTEMDESIYANV